MQSFNQNVIKHKLGRLNLATELGNVSKACKVIRSTVRQRYCVISLAEGHEPVVQALPKARCEVHINAKLPVFQRTLPYRRQQVSRRMLSATKLLQFAS